MVMSNLGVLFLQVFSLRDLLYEWEYFGVFDLVLPFLLIFAIIFGVLSATNILGGNKGINLIISMVIGLMALRLGFVQAFFTELFPRFAIGLAALIIAVILIGLFIPKEHAKGWFVAFGVIGAIIAFVVIAQTFNVLNYFGSYWWQQYAGTIITAILVIAAIIGVVISMREGGEGKPSTIELPMPKLR